MICVKYIGIFHDVFHGQNTSFKHSFINNYFPLNTKNGCRSNSGLIASFKSLKLSS